MKKQLFVLLGITATCAASAAVMDRPMGVRIGQHMTIRPYVSLFYTWDSNVDSQPSGKSSSIFNINPGFTFAYKQDNWGLQGGAYYQYHAYTENSRNLDSSSWGENLAFNWTNSRDGGRGWALVLRENLQQISQDDDMTNDGGRGVGRDRMQFEFAGTLQRRFTDRLHADVDASYYYLDYKNDTSSYAPLYGWSRWTVGAQAGYAASRWTDFLVMGTYQGYTQDNGSDLSARNRDWAGVGNTSQGGTVHIGLGSYATEKISYRVTGGYTHFSYGDGAASIGGFTYSASGHWRMTDTWNMMLLASSYYKPDESNYGSCERVDSFGWGVAHSMIRNKLTATLDLTYRHESRCHVIEESSDVNEDVITGRLALNYIINRYVSVFGRAEYQTAFFRGDYNDRVGADWDYDRWRLSIGLRLTY